MTCSAHTPPPVDGINELDEFFRDSPNPAESKQTDIEDWVPTSQPAMTSAPLVSLKPAPTTNNKQTSSKQKKGANHTSGKKKHTSAGQGSQPAKPTSGSEPLAQEVAVADNAIDGNASEITTPATAVTVQAPSNAQCPRPRPLGFSLTPAPMPPVHALGDYLASVVAAVERLVQAPVAMILSSMLAMLSVLAQGHVNVRQLHGGSSPTSLFFLTLGESGTRKSTVDAKVTRGAEWAEEALRDAADANMPAEFCQRIIRTGTTEGILRVLKNGAGSAAILNDDAGSFFGGSTMSAENRMKTTAWLSQVWDGRTINHVLADSERTILHQGIIGRILVTAPDSNIGDRTIRKADAADEKIVDDFAAEIRDRITADLPYRDGSQELKPRDLALPDDAWEIFGDYAQKVENAQRAFGRYAHLTGPASKFAENAIRIAGALAFFDNPDVTAMSRDHAIRAVELMKFYAAEMVRLVGAQRQSPLLADAMSVLDWLHEGWVQPTIRFQDFCQRGPVRVAARNRIIVPVLERHGWLLRQAGNGYAGAGDVWAVVSRPEDPDLTTV